MKIQTSCSNINEEELAKLSIGLLNCQLEISGKPQIECTEEMVSDHESLKTFIFSYHTGTIDGLIHPCKQISL